MSASLLDKYIRTVLILPMFMSTTGVFIFRRLVIFQFRILTMWSLVTLFILMSSFFISLGKITTSDVIFFFTFLYVLLLLTGATITISTSKAMRTSPFRFFL